MIGPLAPAPLGLLARALGESYLAYVTGLAPVLWYRLNEGSGNALNGGSFGHNYDGVVTLGAGARQQAGKVGPTDAIRYDAANTMITVTNHAEQANLTTWEYAALLYPLSDGELHLGCFWAWGTGTNEAGARLNSSIGTLWGRVANTTPLNFDTSASTGLTLNQWQWAFCAYNDAGDRKIHLYVGINGVVTEATYIAQPALTGTYRAPTSNFIIGNVYNQQITWDGYYDELLGVNRILTPTERTRLVKLTGV